MVSTVCLLSCALAIGQSGAGIDRQLLPRLSRGQELVYTGSFTEETRGKNVQFTHAWRLESRVFVLDISPQGSQVAFLTVLKPRPAQPGPGEKPADSTSARLALARVDSQGRATPMGGVSLAVPLDGPVTIEAGAFIDLAKAQTTAGRTWEVSEEGRPVRVWKLAGTESVNGSSCLKLIGVQQSDDWDQPRADRSAWRRRDTVWILPSLGVACRLERIVEQREPARREPGYRLSTSYNLDSRIVYPGMLSDDRRREILLIHNLTEKAKPFLAQPEKVGPRFFEELIAKIAYHQDNQAATPYREALAQLKKRFDSARLGESAPVLPSDQSAPVTPVIALGQPAPDFVVPAIGVRESARLRRFLGKPILMVFYNPPSKNADEILKFAQSVVANGRQFTAIGLPMSDDSERILKQRDEMHLTFPLVCGQGLSLTYAVDATPKFVVLDASGIVRGAYVGWGRETAGIIMDELKRWSERSDSK
jgi:peroxiredoxin